MRGATDDEIARTFGVSPGTFGAWRKAYPSFEKALDQGRLSVDADVVVSLYRQTQGYEYEEEVAAGKEGRVVTLKKYFKPDTRACEYWLNNRQPENWGSRTTITGGRKDGAELPIGVKVETRNELIDSILALIPSKPDGNSKPAK